MAIKTNGITTIEDTRKGTFRTLNVVSTQQLLVVNPLVRDTIYDSDEAKLLSWNGTEWA